MTAWRAPVPAEALATLKRRLAALPPRHPDRREMMASTCRLYAVSRATLYRLLRGERRPRDAHRVDRGHARVMGDADVERWCEIIAAVKKSTTNRKGRHLSTARMLKLVEEHGVHTPDGHRQLAPGLLTISTLNRYMRRLGYDQTRMTREPAAVRFQADRANDLALT